MPVRWSCGHLGSLPHMRKRIDLGRSRLPARAARTACARQPADLLLPTSKRRGDRSLARSRFKGLRKPHRSYSLHKCGTSTARLCLSGNPIEERSDPLMLATPGAIVPGLTPMRAIRTLPVSKKRSPEFLGNSAFLHCPRRMRKLLRRCGQRSGGGGVVGAGGTCR